MSELVRFIMNEWAKVIFAALVGGITVFTGNYVSMQVSNGQYETRLNHVESTLDDRAKYVEQLTVNTQRLNSMETLVNSLGPDLKALGKSVNELNINLTNSNGSISLNTQRLEDVRRSQEDMSDDIKEINRRLK